jgi:DNA recombination protein RmuC
LKAVSYGWRQEQMAENAQEVSNLAKTLYDRLRVFTNHFDDIGRNLDRALDAYNKGVRSLETRVLVTARRFKERGAIAGEEIETLEPIDKATRPLSFDDGGLFPEEEMPLLKARSARSGKK